MRNFKSALIAIALLAALGAYIHFFEKGPVKDPKDQPADKLFTQAAVDVRSFVMELPSEKGARPVSLAQDEKGEWSILLPERFAADQGAIRNVLSSLTDCRPESEIKTPKDLADYGLATPSARSAFFMRDGSTFKVEVGDKNVSGTHTYLRVVDRPSVYLVSNENADWFKKKVEDLRNRRIFPATEASSQRIRWTSGARRIELQKGKDGSWTMLVPRKTGAAVELVRQFVSALDSVQASGFPDDHPTSLGRYGLSSPKVKVELWEEGVATPRVLSIGSDRPSDRKVYVRSSASPYVYLVNPEMVGSLREKKPGDFRSKTFMQFTADSVTRLVLRKGGKALTYTKDQAAVWSSKERPMAASEAPGILAPLATTMVLEYVEEGVATGLERPSVTAEVTLQDGTTRVYRYGRRVGEDKVYLASDQGTDALLVASYIPNAMDALFNAPTKSAAPAR